MPENFSRKLKWLNERKKTMEDTKEEFSKDMEILKVKWKFCK
jgi:hypothetical protein